MFSINLRDESGLAPYVKALTQNPAPHLLCSMKAIALYAKQQPEAVLSLATEAGARALDAHIIPHVQVRCGK